MLEQSLALAKLTILTRLISLMIKTAQSRLKPRIPDIKLIAAVFRPATTSRKLFKPCL